MAVRVLVNGFGTIGKRVAWAVSLQKDMKLVGIVNRSANANMYNFLGRNGCLKGTPVFASQKEFLEPLKASGFNVQGTLEDALREQKTDVIIDATPAGIDKQFKPLYEKYGIPAIFQGGASADIAPVSFTACANYEQAFNQKQVRVVSCNTTSLVRTLAAIDESFGVEEANVVLIRRAVDPADDEKGPVDSIVPVTTVPSHHGPDVQTVLPKLNIFTMAAVVPVTLCHTHFVTVKLKTTVPAPLIVQCFEKAGRIALFDQKKGYTSTSVLMEYFRDINRPRGDMYETVVWKDSISVSSSTLRWIHAVHSEAIVIPENIDAIRAITGIEKNKEKSIAQTNKSLGVLSYR